MPLSSLPKANPTHSGVSRGSIISAYIGLLFASAWSTTATSSSFTADGSSWWQPWGSSQFGDQMGQVSEKSSRRDTEPSRKLMYTENKTTSRNIMMIMIGKNETMLIDPILIWITLHLRPLLKLQVRCKNRHLEEFKDGEFLLAFADSWKLCAAHCSWSSFWRPCINLTYDFSCNLFPN